MSFPAVTVGNLDTDDITDPLTGTAKGVTQEFLQKLLDRDQGARIGHATLSFSDHVFKTTYKTVARIWLPETISVLRVEAEAYYDGPAGDNPKMQIRLGLDPSTETALQDYGTPLARILFPQITVPVSMRGTVKSLEARGEDSGGIGQRHHLQNLYDSSTHGYGLLLG